MKRSVRASFLAMPAIAVAGAFLAFSGAPANASAPAVSSPSSAGGVVSVCPGVSYNSQTDANGAPLTKEAQHLMAEHAAFKCGHPSSKASGKLSPGRPSSGSGSVIPDGTDTGVGYLSADLVINPGQTSYWSDVSSMPVGPSKTLTCEISWNSGPFEYCGSASGTGSWLSTVTNSVCPAPGEYVEVDAWLDIYGGQYWDAATGWTQ